MMERLVILGGGESGAGAAKLEKKLGMRFLSDKGSWPTSISVCWRNWGKYEEATHEERISADLVVKSPVFRISCR